MAGNLAVVLYGMLQTKATYDEVKHRKALGLPERGVTSVVSTVEASVAVVGTLDDEAVLLSEGA